MVQGELCPQTVIPAEVPELLIDPGDSAKILLGQQAEDGENHLIRKGQPVIDRSGAVFLVTE